MRGGWGSFKKRSDVLVLINNQGNFNEKILTFTAVIVRQRFRGACPEKGEESPRK